MSSSDSEGTETDQDGYDTLEVTADGDMKTTHINLEESSNGDSEDKEGGSEKEGGGSKKNSARSEKGDEDKEGGGSMLESDELSDKSEKSKARRTKRTSELIADSPRTGDDDDTTTDPGSEMSEIGDKLPPGTEGVKKKVVRALIKTGKNLREVPGKKKIVAPYIIATMEGQKETMKCKLGNTLLPAWNAKLMFILGTEPDSANLLRFQVFDAKGQTKDELLGETTIDIMKLDWKKKRFEFKDHKLTHPKNDVQGKLHFIILLSERSFAVETPPANPKQEKKKLDAQKKQEEKAKKQEEKKKKEAEKGSLRRLKASENNNGKGTLGKNSKPVTEKHTIETKAGIAAPPDLLWNFISNFHDVEEWMDKMPCDVLEAEEDGKLRRKIKYPDHDGVIEKLEEKDDPNMTLKWSSTCKEGEKGLAGTVGYLVTLIIAPVGRSRSRVTWQVEYELPLTSDDSEAKKFFEKLVEIGMDGLKVAAEG